MSQSHEIQRAISTFRENKSKILELEPHRIEKNETDRKLARSLLENLCGEYGFTIDDYLGNLEKITPRRRAAVIETFITLAEGHIPDYISQNTLKITPEAYEHNREKLRSFGVLE